MPLQFLSSCLLMCWPLHCSLSEWEPKVKNRSCWTRQSAVMVEEIDPVTEVARTRHLQRV